MLPFVCSYKLYRLLGCFLPACSLVSLLEFQKGPLDWSGAAGRVRHLGQLHQIMHVMDAEESESAGSSMTAYCLR